MSSTAIAAQITGCQSEIDSCSMRIKQLVEMLNQKYDRGSDFAKKKNDIQERLDYQKKRADVVKAYVSENKVAAQYKEQTVDYLSVQSVQNRYNQLDSIHDKVLYEINSDEEKLDLQRAELRRLQEQINVLHDEYSRELEREAQEAATVLAVAKKAL